MTTNNNEGQTPKAIGPTFRAELAAAGLLGQHFSWSSDGTLEFFDDTPADVVNRVQAAYAAHNPDAVESLGNCKARLLRDIDATADAARLAVAGDPLRAAEYQVAEAEAKAYQAAGYAIECPPSVKSWAEAKQWSTKQAAENILAEAAAWNAALYAIRDARLKAKESVRNALTAEDATAIATAAIEGIKAKVANLGNAAS